MQQDERQYTLAVMPQAVASSWKKNLKIFSTITLWKHQQSIYEWLAPMGSAMVSADMGVGKTLIGIKAGSPDGREVTYCDITKGPVKKRVESLDRALKFTPADKSLFVLVNYESVWRGDLAKLVEKTPWTCLILDESHRVKSATGKASRWLARLGLKHPKAKRLCLTGTPMPQSPLDLFGQFRFLDSSVFGTSFSRMRARYAICDPRFPSKVRRYINQDELASKLDAHSYRVEADDVLSLPDAIHETIPIELSPATRRLYKALKDDLTGDLEAGKVTVGNALSRLLRLQQATSGVARLDDGGTVHIDGVPAKRRALEDRLNDLHATEPVVVFCRFRSDLEEVAAAARELGREYAEVSGSRKDLERWQAGDAVILGVQIQSGGLGIDCSRAAFAFYYSLGFSLGDYEQSLARLRRPGQTRMVRYYHLVATGTVDEQVYAALRERRNVIEGVMERLTDRMEVKS